uniref:small monomeric GTPase n=1 Tax=Sphaeramia orbicularis TaxID=375764 RepID=A0A673C590_9TELE
MKTLEIDGVKVRVQIWDTAGQERYQTITKQYYRRAQGIIFVYDITNEPSFQRIVKWAGDVDEVRHKAVSFHFLFPCSEGQFCFSLLNLVGSQEHIPHFSRKFCNYLLWQSYCHGTCVCT